ncbi:MAG: hypothetical protein ABI151_06330 [Chitinophagaceae bacterium]
MKKSNYLVAGLIMLCLGCGPSRRIARISQNVSASISKEGFFTCFEPGVTAGGQPVWCEASAILYDGSKLLLANDKDMPETRSSVFYYPFVGGFADTSKMATYLTEPAYKKAKKFEDFAFTPDSKWVFLSTAFDRVKPDSKDWDGYNTIFYWPTGDEHHPKVLTAGGTDTTSISLRMRFANALRNDSFKAGMPYFKIEGLAATEDRLYFGIREQGKKFDDFTYAFKILSAPYIVNNGTVELGDSITTVLDLDLAKLHPELEKNMGISCIEYDRFNKRFLMLSSFEGPDKMGGYLWTATSTELANKTIHLVNDAQGKPLAFQHKPEDLTLISAKRLLIVHDDDRLVTKVGNQSRLTNQAAYSVVDFK